MNEKLTNTIENIKKNCDSLSLEDEQISDEAFEAKQVVAVGPDLDLVGHAAVLLCHNLVLQNKT